MDRPGIISVGAYLPRLRLERSAIAAATGWSGAARGAPAMGRRSYCAWDEDSVTMAVEAARDCLVDADRSAVTWLALASTTHPFADRLNCGIAADALGLRDALQTSDASGHQRAGVGALLDALSHVRSEGGQALVLAADRRTAKPASEQELRFGHGAAAVLIGQDGVAAEWLGSATLRADFVDHYRAADATSDYTLEERWVRDEGYLKIVPRAIEAALTRSAVEATDVRHLVVQGPARFAAAVARRLRMPESILQDDLHGECGDTGVAHPLLMTTAVLERAAAGDVIVVAGFGQGCTVIVLRATGRRAVPGQGCSGAVAAGTSDREYLRFLANCGLVELDLGMRAERDSRTAQSVAWRKHRDLLGFVGGRCTRCGTVQYPKSRACVNPQCRAFDTQQDHPFAGSTGRVKTFTEDWLALSRSPPCVYGNVALDGGGNLFAEFADTARGELSVGTPVRFVFRIKDFDATRDFRRYFWKAIPVRS